MQVQLVNDTTKVIYRTWNTMLPAILVVVVTQDS